MISTESDKILKIGHQANSGDLIALLPGLRHLYRTEGIRSEIRQRIGLKREDHILKDKDGDSICMDEKMFRMLKPLIESQEYISSFKEWRGEKVDWDMTKIQQSAMLPLPYLDIHFWSVAMFPELACDLSEPWIEAGISYEHKKVMMDYYGRRSKLVLVNRTERYNNPYISYAFLKTHEDKLLFSGTVREHEVFSDQNKLHIPRLEILDFLTLAKAIKASDFIICNQSLNFHIADGMKKNRILEICGEFPNTWPTGRNGYAFLYQEALELYVEKLIN